MTIEVTQTYNNLQGEGRHVRLKYGVLTISFQFRLNVLTDFIALFLNGGELKADAEINQPIIPKKHFTESAGQIQITEFTLTGK